MSANRHVWEIQGCLTRGPDLGHEHVTSHVLATTIDKAIDVWRAVMWLRENEANHGEFDYPFRAEIFSVSCVAPDVIVDD